MKNHLRNSFDAVVMLTWSNWHTEPRSNRYHYALRFSKHRPVIFVQADLDEPTYKFESTELQNVIILHLWNRYDRKQTHLLRKALLEKKITNPLFWVYNYLFSNFIAINKRSFIVYHATEDYLISEWRCRINKGTARFYQLLHVLNNTDLIVSVSEGVENGLVTIGQYKGEKIVATNGCDYKFFAEPIVISFKNSKQIALYQGNIFAEKINFSLLEKLAQELPDWEFWFCGRFVYQDRHEITLFDLPNVRYLGDLSPEKLRDCMHQATVGLMPFMETDHIIRRSFPLKAFEYLACGLPVVTVPIYALKAFSNLFYFAQTASEFKDAILQASKTRYDETLLTHRLKEAELQDYDHKFSIVYSTIKTLYKENIKNTGICTSIKYRPSYMINAFIMQLLLLKQELVYFKQKLAYFKHKLIYFKNKLVYFIFRNLNVIFSPSLHTVILKLIPSPLKAYLIKNIPPKYKLYFKKILSISPKNLLKYFKFLVKSKFNKIENKSCVE